MASVMLRRDRDRARAATLAVTILAGLAGITACGPATTGNGGAANGGSAGFDGNLAGSSGTTLGSAGTTGGGGSEGMAGAGGTGSVPAGRATGGLTPMPCDVSDIIKTSCQSCHAATPLSGVPMALLSWEDTQQPSVSNPSMTVHELMKLRIHSADKPMPPPPGTPLSAEKLAVLDAWLDGGAIAGTDPSCKVPDPMMYGGVIPPDAENCYELRAHANSTPGDTAPLMVGANSENYSTFYFDAPWPEGAQGVYFETLPGDHPEILHHWLIYLEENQSQPDGTVVYPAPGTHASAPTLVAGWAPGANNNDIPSDVGMMLSTPNKKISMEIHWFNLNGVAKPTNAGVKICTVEKHLRPNTATVSWLGTELGINLPPMAASTAVGTCTPQYTTGDIHIIRSWPHMHLMGRSMNSTIIRANGTREEVSPADGWPFDFNSEVSWPTPIVVHPGDKVETKCNYVNTSNRAIQVGFENQFEMCFNFTLAYPAKALVNKGLIGSTSLTNSATACLY